MAQLKFLSLNCHGFNKATLCYLQSVIHNYDIVLLQETWLSNQSSYVMDNIHPGFNVYHTSAMEHKLTSGQVTGRPFGVTAILVRENIFKHITPVSVNTTRATAIYCSTPDHCNLVVMSVYMPWDDNMMNMSLLLVVFKLPLMPTQTVISFSEKTGICAKMVVIVLNCVYGGVFVLIISFVGLIPVLIILTIPTIMMLILLSIISFVLRI